MARIAGVDLPRDKSIQYALPILYGIGKHNVVEVLAKAEVDPRRKVKDLSEADVAKLREVIPRGAELEPVRVQHHHAGGGSGALRVTPVHARRNGAWRPGLSLVTRTAACNREARTGS